MTASAFTRGGPPGRTPSRKWRVAAGAAAASPPDPPRIVSGTALDDAPRAPRHRGEGVNGYTTASAALLGLSQVSAAGTGIEALRDALRGKRPEPEWVACNPADPDARVPVLRCRPVSLESLAEPAVLRRMDAFSQRALLAGSLALREAGASREGPERTGLVVASAHGPLTTMFRYLDQVLDRGDGRGSPVLFASSLHNAPAAYLSLLLGMRGPSLTVTGFHHAFARALRAALDWLERDAVARVLLIADDEFHPVLGYGLRGLGRCAPDGRMRPLAFDRASWVSGETCVAFVLERPGDEPSRWGRLGSPIPFRGPLPRAATDDVGAPVFLAARGDPDEGWGYAAALPIAAPVAAYSPLWGANPTSEAMTLAVAAVTLAARTLFPVPDADGAPAGVQVAASGPSGATAIQCCCMDDRGNGVAIAIRRGGSG